MTDGPVRRVALYGVTGSGKSTAAERISRATGLPWYSVDDLTWQPGRVAVPAAEQRRRIAEVCAGEEWLPDAMYGTWTDIVLGRADLVVALDYPRWSSFGRLLRRTASRIAHRSAVCGGNRETVRTALARDSILWWHVTSFRRKRRRMRRWAADPSGPAVVLCRRPRELDAWLSTAARR